jgi:hypothetical protein
VRGVCRSAAVSVLPDKTVVEHKFIPNQAEILLPPARIKRGIFFLTHQQRTSAARSRRGAG